MIVWEKKSYSQVTEELLHDCMIVWEKKAYSQVTEELLHDCLRKKAKPQDT